jgi:hypothetical protein
VLEFGVPRHPLFFFYSTWNFITARVAQFHPKRDLANVLQRRMSVDEFAEAFLVEEDDHEKVAGGADEDDDVRRERELMESGRCPQEAPIQVVGLRKVYPGNKVAVSTLSLHIDKNECFGEYCF